MIARQPARPSARQLARPSARHEHGYTLQTLIIMAILALVAVAAGVVIVALINRSGEDVADRSRYTYSTKCNSVEVYDNQAAARFESSNANGAVVGSQPGCIPVCFWKDDNGNGMLEATDTLIFDPQYEAADLVFKSPDENDVLMVDAGDVLAIATANRFFVARARGRPAATAEIAFESGKSMVSASGDNCQIS